ncbi:hypothetical protein [Frateuria terrea]|uniref:DUF4340 domain-containing protein n=1 Tax=Frateuria terrea TaxID=529704 RepID=A0A1H6X6F8_9GAMM|nr:hypothetical protein [Frateuria terrea]SEJ22177.1 hypothetical protein SAMN04487997_2757 [Frateuria terrea]SFP58532.1 hypothetical protein SAMN02927913_2734 [Frateuria terrea]
MRRAARQRWITLGALLVLLALATAQYRHDQRQAPGTLLALDPASIVHVVLTLPGLPPENYQRHDGHWWRADGRRADEGRLQELVDIAQAPVISWRPAADFDAAKIGLAPAMARLQLDGQVLDFGTTAVTGPLRYVRVGERIALVPLRYTPRPATQDAQRIH